MKAAIFPPFVHTIDYDFGAVPLDYQDLEMEGTKATVRQRTFYSDLCIAALRFSVVSQHVKLREFPCDACCSAFAL